MWYATHTSSMARYQIVRDEPGWAVRKNGRRVISKTYQQKKQAVAAARRKASAGDSIQAQRRDGTWGPERTVNTPGPGGDV